MNSNPSQPKFMKNVVGPCGLPQLPSPVDSSWQVCRDWAIPSETQCLKSTDSLAPTMQPDWYHPFVTSWLVTVKE